LIASAGPGGSIAGALMLAIDIQGKSANKREVIAVHIRDLGCH
jgi:hypothetical protein